MPITENAKHTAGPWKIEDDEIVGQRYVCKLSNWYITAAGGGYDAENALLQAEKDANARLIAASPELLQALEYVQEIIKTARKYFPKSMHNSDRFQLENTCATVGSAIHKAKGE